MPSIMLGRERFALPIGETRVGGSGNDALPFSALRDMPPVAVLVVTSDDAVSVRSYGSGANTATVNGVPLGAEPVTVGHGDKIEVGGLRLILRDGRETGSTGEMTAATREITALARTDRAAGSVPEGARLVRTGTSTSIDVLDSGLVIGRDADSDLVVAGADVSRRHAVVRRTDRGYVVTDVSRNGTFLNGQRVEGSLVMQIGDVLRIGDEEFRFEAGAARPDPMSTPRVARPEQLPEPATAMRPAGGWRRLVTRWRR